MAVITIDNFPDELYAKLNARAIENGRVVSDEIVEAAQKLVGAKAFTLTVAEKLALADTIRASTAGAWIDDEFIRRARNEGRM
jgi:plasmid stability protein